MKLKNAIILAAGLGNRLNSISGSKPKCLVEIEGKPILFYTLTKLIREGYGKICIVTGYNSSQIENYIKFNFPQVKIVFNERYLSYGNFESLKLGLKSFGEITQVTVLDADILFETSILEKIDVERNLILSSIIKLNHDPVYISIGNGKIIFLSKDSKNGLDTNSEYIGIFNMNQENIKLVTELKYTNTFDYEQVFHANKLNFNQLDVSEFNWFELDDQIHLNTINSLPTEVKMKILDVDAQYK